MLGFKVSEIALGLANIKYKELHDRPHLVLIKMNRSIDVISLLSACKSLPDHLAIKPDLTFEERQLDSILMKERWGFIQSGQNIKDIKIQSTKIYLKGNLYEGVTDLKFVPCSNKASSGSAVVPAIKQNEQTTSNDETLVMDTANKIDYLLQLVTKPIKLGHLFV